MRLALPQYNGQDNKVMFLISPPLVIVLNSLYLGAYYFSSISIFLAASIVSLFMWAIHFIACGSVAVALKRRFPNEEDLAKKLTMMIVTFFLMSGLFLLILFSIYEKLSLIDYAFDEQNFAWSYFALGIFNIFITFVMEGIGRFNEWRENLNETEKLNGAYKQRQL